MNFLKKSDVNIEIDKNLLKQNEIEINGQHQIFLQIMIFFCVIGGLIGTLVDKTAYLQLNLIDILFLLVFLLGLRLTSSYLPKENPIFKYLLLFVIYIPFTVQCVIAEGYCWIALAIPIIMSCRYFSTSLVIKTSIASQVALVVGGIGVTFIQPMFGYANSSAVYIPKGHTIIGSGLSMDEEAAILLNSGIVGRGRYIYFLFTTQLVFFSLLFLLISVLCLWITRQEKLILQRQTTILLEQKKHELELADSRYKITISQIQPHFIFNVLNSAYELCEIDPTEAREMLLAFSKYLRHDIDSLASTKPIRFARELESVEQYLKLEQMRFGERLKVKYDIQTTSFLILPLILQPLVENAVKHGICKKPGGGTVTIRTRKVSAGYEITVEDDGVGFVPGEQKKDHKEHVGLTNVKTRVEEQMKSQFQVESSVGLGTRITIKIPKEISRNESTDS